MSWICWSCGVISEEPEVSRTEAGIDDDEDFEGELYDRCPECGATDGEEAA